MSPQASQTGRRGRWSWAGGGLALAAILQFLPGLLGTFELQKLVAATISALLVVVGVLAGQHSARRAQLAEKREREAALGGALLRWPAPDLTDISADDLGVGESPADVYVARDRDADMDAALRDDLMLVVFGPPGAGKSRSAFEAARRWSASEPHPAVVLAPRDAGGLELLLAERRDHVLKGSSRGLLWLDGLERYLADLSIDRLRTFIAGVDPPPVARMPFGRWLGSAASVAWLEYRLGGRLRRMALGRPPSRVALVATIRDDDLAELLASPAVEGQVLRQLLSGGGGVPLAGQLSDGELRAFELARGAAAPDPAVSAAFATDWRAGWERAAAATPPPVAPPAGVDAMRWVLIALIVVLGGFLVGVGNHSGWRIPPPLAAQVASLTAGHRGCQRVANHPKDGAGLARTGQPDDGVLVTIVAGGECRQSDEVRLYRLGTDGRLSDLAALRPAPAPDPRLVFSCIGPSLPDPCQLTLGDTTYVAGAFRDPADDRELPVLMTVAEADVALAALAPPAGDDAPESESAFQLRLSKGGRVATGPGGGSCASDAVCIRGPRAYAAAVAPESERHPALVLLAYDEDGSDREFEYRIWQLTLARDRPVLADDCITVSEGRVRRQRVTGQSAAQVREALQRAARRTSTSIVC